VIGSNSATVSDGLMPGQDADQRAEQHADAGEQQVGRLDRDQHAMRKQLKGFHRDAFFNRAAGARADPRAMTTTAPS
jgi:hypothetical protein